MVVRPTPPFGEKRQIISSLRASPGALRCSWTLRTIVVRSKPEKGIFRTLSTPRSALSLTGFCGTVSMTIADLRLGLADAQRHVSAGDAALQQRVDDDDVGLELADGGHRAVARGHDVKHLDLGLACSSGACAPRPAGRPRSPGAGSVLLASLPSTLRPQRPPKPMPPSSLTRAADHQDPTLTGRGGRVQIVRAVRKLEGQSGLPDELGECVIR